MKVISFASFCMSLIMISCHNQDDSDKINALVEQDVIYQRSTIDALLAGRYDDTLSLSQLYDLGTLGIGTLSGLDGELIVLDGAFYQVDIEGKVNLLTPEVTTPFITLTDFDPQDSIDFTKKVSFDELESFLDSKINKANNIISFKIHGQFDSLLLRSVPKQIKPYRPLADVVANQSIFPHNNISGTMVGFKFPEYLSGVNVPGYHFHFLSDDKKVGGHVLELKIRNGTALFDQTGDLYLSLPNDEDFQQQDLEIDRTEELRKVEKNDG